LKPGRNNFHELLEAFSKAETADIEAAKKSPPIHLLAAAGCDKKEKIHSNLLRWLLDPRDTHAQGTLFLGELVRHLRIKKRCTVNGPAENERALMLYGGSSPSSLSLHLRLKISLAWCFGSGGTSCRLSMKSGG
jgi:hypothetical protein